MAIDAQATRVVLNYGGGAATMTRGLADTLFGPTWRLLQAQPVSKTVSVKAHNRVRVIGQPSKAVAAHQYTFKAYPTMDAEAAQGGQACRVRLADGTTWTIRVSGSMADFIEWFQVAVNALGVQVYSQRGTIYGPFGSSLVPTP